MMLFATIILLCHTHYTYVKIPVFRKIFRATVQPRNQIILARHLRQLSNPARPSISHNKQPGPKTSVWAVNIQNTSAQSSLKSSWSFMREVNRGIRNSFERFMIFVHDISMASVPASFPRTPTVSALSSGRNPWRKRGMENRVPLLVERSWYLTMGYGFQQIASHLIRGSIYGFLD